jgi:hypothetical protein
MGRGHARRCSAHIFIDLRPLDPADPRSPEVGIRERCEQPAWHATDEANTTHLATRVVRAIAPDGTIYETLATVRWLAKPVTV